MKQLVPFCLLVVLSAPLAQASDLQLSEAVIVTRPGEVPSAERAAAETLALEMEKRLGARPTTTSEWPEGSKPVIVVSARVAGKVWDRELPIRSGESLPETRAEGYRVHVDLSDSAKPVVWVVGADPRGTVFGVGYLLRQMRAAQGMALVPADLDHATSPAYPIRGHQLGYRPRANSWDAWTLEQFEDYIRELALFGTNCIENIPFQDSDPGPHMKLTRDEMNIRMGEICAKYDLDYWVWTPAEFPLEDEVKRKEMLARHEAFYRACPRLDGVFVPGGDPGDNHPSHVMPFLKELADLLAKYHPRAGVWVSMQGFEPEKVDYVHEYIDRERPKWLRGLVAGPSAPPLSETRRRLPKEYMLRDYPDITHNTRAQYPVFWWDPALAATLGREAINPRPVDYAGILRHTIPYTDGFLSYSDGVHDDVNKLLWSLLGWDPDMPVRDAMIEYSRFFFGDRAAERAADGILALESNWHGSLADNGAVDGTLALWAALEKEFPENSDNWRWLCLVFRAYYDAYTRHRLIYENELEKEACRALEAAPQVGSEAAMKEALAILRRGETERVKSDWRDHIFELAQRLFDTIALQTSVPKYGASGAERGASLDFVDRPLNNLWWYEDEFAAIKKFDSEAKKLERLAILASWENPGPGSFYDDVGDIAQSEHVIFGEDANTDPLFERNPCPGFMWWEGGLSRRRNSWPAYMDLLIGMRYDGLDPSGNYTVRITGIE
ncbi:MAG: hypothetical protein HUU16_14305, partial [Candidatus Omnitrophica bacterium]|nr:hypothetical protein [Candidatus Omnitrophota bacterium]